MEGLSLLLTEQEDILSVSKCEYWGLTAGRERVLVIADATCSPLCLETRESMQQTATTETMHNFFVFFVKKWHEAFQNEHIFYLINI